MEQPQANYLPEEAASKKKDFTQMSALQGKDYGKSKMKSNPDPKLETRNRSHHHPETVLDRDSKDGL